VGLKGDCHLDDQKRPNSQPIDGGQHQKRGSTRGKKAGAHLIAKARVSGGMRVRSKGQKKFRELLSRDRRRDPTKTKY